MLPMYLFGPFSRSRVKPTREWPGDLDHLGRTPDEERSRPQCGASGERLESESPSGLEYEEARTTQRTRLDSSIGNPSKPYESSVHT
jgi:hypothetical protein